MKTLTQSERAYLESLQVRWCGMREYLAAVELDFTSGTEAWLRALGDFRKVQGNISNPISFLACLLAKDYLAKRFDVSNFDAASKAQGAPGLDIDFIADKERIIGEIKTTVPYSGAKNDFGAQQKMSFRADFLKLGRETADHKFLFVTNRRTHEIILRKYSHELLGVEIVLLSDLPNVGD